MSALENARHFFHACESAQGWAGCQSYVADGATFHSVAASYDGMTTVKAYCEQIADAFTTLFAGSTYELHASVHDSETARVFIYGTSYAKHTGAGGPVPATQKDAVIPFVYVMTMDADDRLAHLEKVYDEASGRRQLGWPQELAT